MTILNKFRTVGLAIAVAGFALTGVGAAQANSDNPFGPKVPYIPPKKAQTQDNQDRPFSTPRQQPRYRNVQHYLLGTWSGTLRNGQPVVIRFNNKGQFVMVFKRARVAYVGRYQVRGMKMQLVFVGKCTSAQNCTRLPQQRRAVFNISPRNRNAMQTMGGFFQRTA